MSTKKRKCSHFYKCQNILEQDEKLLCTTCLRIKLMKILSNQVYVRSKRLSLSEN